MTDISVNIVDSSKDLISVPFSNPENETDPLAIHDIKVNIGEDDGLKTEGVTENCEGNAKELTGSQNGNEASVLEEISEDVDGNHLSSTEEAIAVTTEDRTADLIALDANAPTPDLPDHMSSEAIDNDLDNTEVDVNGQEHSDTHIETNVISEETDEIEAKLREFETPIEETEPKISAIIPDSDSSVVCDKDKNSVVESKPLMLNNDVEMNDTSISVEERVQKLFESDVIETVSETKQTENKIGEKNSTKIEKTEATNRDIIPKKSETTETTKYEKFLQKSETLPEKTETVVDSSKEASEIKALLEKPIEKEEIKRNTEKSETVAEKIETVPVKSETVTTKAVAFTEKTDQITKSTEAFLRKSEHAVSNLVAHKEVPENLSNLPEIPDKMEVDTEKVDNFVPDKIRVKNFDLKENKSSKNMQPINGDIAKDDQPTKRRASDDIEESPLKRLCQEVEKTFPNHDSMINEYIQSATKNNIDEIQSHTEQLLAEIQTLRELAQKKEQEWNNILHLKKVKEEILLRLLRRKQVLSFEKSVEINGSTSERSDPFDYLNSSKNLAIDKSDEISGLSLKQPGPSSVLQPTISPINPLQNLNAMTPVMPVTSHFNPMTGLPPPYDKAAAAHMQTLSNNMQNMSNNMQNMSPSMQNMSNNLQNMQNMSNMQSMNMQNMPKPVYQPMMMPGPMPGFPRDIGAMNGQMNPNYMPMGRQGPTKDVKSIIADYRQRNPDVTPRRGRRMKSILNPNMMNVPRNMGPKEGMNNMNNLNMLFNNLDMNQKAMLERLQQMQAGGLPNSIFKDALVQFASMQQANAGLMPSRPMETSRPMDTNRPEHHAKERRRVERPHEEPPAHKPPPERLSSPRLPPPPYPEISLLPVSTAQDSAHSQSLLHGILTKPSVCGAPTLAQLLTSPDRERSPLPLFGQAKNCGEITITPVQPTAEPQPQPEKPEEVVQLDDEESPAPSETEAADSPAGGRLVIDETSSGGAAAAGGGEETPLCQGCRRRDAQFVCAGCANQWYCSRDCQVAAWDDHSEMCSG